MYIGRLRLLMILMLAACPLFGQTTDLNNISSASISLLPGNFYVDVHFSNALADPGADLVATNVKISTTPAIVFSIGSVAPLSFTQQGARIILTGTPPAAPEKAQICFAAITFVESSGEQKKVNNLCGPLEILTSGNVGAQVPVLIQQLQAVPKAHKVTNNKRQFLANDKKAWNDLTEAPTSGSPGGPCYGNTNTDACAQAAIVYVTTVCAESAQFFTKNAGAWRDIGFGLVIVSAVSTAVGASTTLASAKIWSTLGGTTALGAVTTGVNSNVTYDQNGVTSVNNTLTQFLQIVQAAGTTDAMIYRVAPFYATYCEVAATASSGTTAPAATPQAPSSNLTITASTLPNGKVGTPYPGSLAATGGTTPYAWSIASGTLPGPLTLNPSTGVISGTPTAASSTPLTFRVTDSSKPAQTATSVSLTLTITP